MSDRGPVNPFWFSDRKLVCGEPQLSLENFAATLIWTRKRQLLIYVMMCARGAARGKSACVERKKKRRKRNFPKLIFFFSSFTSSFSLSFLLFLSLSLSFLPFFFQVIKKTWQALDFSCLFINIFFGLFAFCYLIQKLQATQWDEGNAIFQSSWQDISQF